MYSLYARMRRQHEKENLEVYDYDSNDICDIYYPMATAGK